MIDVTQQERPWDDIIDDILLKAERYRWDATKLSDRLLQAGVPQALVNSVIKHKGDN